MFGLLINALIAILVVAVTWIVASWLLPHPLAMVITLIVAILCLVYLTRGKAPI